MSDPEDENDRKLLRSVRKRNWLAGLAIFPPLMGLFWVLLPRLADRHHIPRGLAAATLMLVMIIGALVLTELGWDPFGSRRLTPRLRWLQNDRNENGRTRARYLMIFLTSSILLLQLLTLEGTENADGFFLPIMIVLVNGISYGWRLPNTIDELAQAQYLTATHRAYLVTILSCIGAVILDGYRSGLLRNTITAALLAGTLTQQLTLAWLETRSRPRDE